MSQTQYTKDIKRINERAASIERTFGRDSEQYKQYTAEMEAVARVNGIKTGKTSSGRVKITTSTKEGKISPEGIEKLLSKKTAGEIIRHRRKIEKVSRKEAIEIEKLQAKFVSVVQSKIQDIYAFARDKEILQDNDLRDTKGRLPREVMQYFIDKYGDYHVNVQIQPNNYNIYEMSEASGVTEYYEKFD